MSDTPLTQKLLIKPGNSVLLVGAPEGFTLGTLPEGARTVRAAPADVALVFILDKAGLDAFIARGENPVAAGGRFWMCYPKKTGAIKTDIHRDILFPVMGAAGWQGNTMVSLDDTWSAMRFHPPGTR